MLSLQQLLRAYRFALCRAVDAAAPPTATTTLVSTSRSQPSTSSLIQCCDRHYSNSNIRQLHTATRALARRPANINSRSPLGSQADTFQTRPSADTAAADAGRRSGYGFRASGSKHDLQVVGNRYDSRTTRNQHDFRANEIQHEFWDAGNKAFPPTRRKYSFETSGNKFVPGASSGAASKREPRLGARVDDEWQDRQRPRTARRNDVGEKNASPEPSFRNRGHHRNSLKTNPSFRRGLASEGELDCEDFDRELNTRSREGASGVKISTELTEEKFARMFSDDSDEGGAFYVNRADEGSAFYDNRADDGGSSLRRRRSIDSVHDETTLKSIRAAKSLLKSDPSQTNTKVFFPEGVHVAPAMQSVRPEREDALSDAANVSNAAEKNICGHRNQYSNLNPLTSSHKPFSSRSNEEHSPGVRSPLSNDISSAEIINSAQGNVPHWYSVGKESSSPSKDDHIPFNSTHASLSSAPLSRSSSSDPHLKESSDLSRDYSSLSNEERSLHGFDSSSTSFVPSSTSTASSTTSSNSSSSTSAYSTSTSINPSSSSRVDDAHEDLACTLYDNAAYASPARLPEVSPYMRAVAPTGQDYASLLRERVASPPNSRLLKVALLGLPNSGKSTLINALTDEKVCSVSRKVHTTQRLARAISCWNETQLVFLDTPGIVTPEQAVRHRLSSTLVHDAERSVQQADVLVVVHDASTSYSKLGLHPRLLRILALNPTIPVVLVINKVDKVKNKRLLLPLTRLLTDGVVGDRVSHERLPPPTMSPLERSYWPKERMIDEMLTMLHRKKEGGRGDMVDPEEEPIMPVYRLNDNTKAGSEMKKEEEKKKCLAAEGEQQVCEMDGKNEVIEQELDTPSGNHIQDAGVTETDDSWSAVDQQSSAVVPYSSCDSMLALRTAFSPDIQVTYEDLLAATGPIILPDTEDLMDVYRRPRFDLNEEDVFAGRVHLSEDQAAQFIEGRQGWPKFNWVLLTSGKDNDGVDKLRDLLLELAQPAPWAYSSNIVTDQDPYQLAVLTVREKYMNRLKFQLPYELKFEVEHWDLGDADTLHVAVRVICRKESTVKLLVGAAGCIVKDVAKQAEQDLDGMFKTDVKLRVRVMAASQLLLAAN